MNNPTIKPMVAPFKKFCMSIGALPTSYKDSLDYYETLLWLIKYLENVVIPVVNNNGEAVTELQTLYIQLKDFVENYFANLDVQEEINNKLDNMVEEGTLQEIIGEYLNANALWCFDNVNDMKNASNLKNGSYAKTIGYSEKNDGNSQVYYIRNKEVSDVIDNINIIQMTNTNLIAEKIKNEAQFIFPKNFTNAYSGDCNIIKYNKKVIMIDTYREENYSDVQSMLANYNITHIDYLILTHYHGDHIGNFENLVQSGYVNSETVLYFPAPVTKFEQYTSLPSYFQNYCAEHGLNYYVPTELEVLQLGELKLTFYNCNPTILDTLYYDTSSVKNYNNCSTVVKINYNEVQCLYTADCLTEAIKRIYDNKFVKGRVNLYKVEHHGIENTTFKDFIYDIKPIYSYQSAGILDYQKKILFTSCETTKILQDINCSNYIMFQQNDYVEFISNGITLNCKKGKSGIISKRNITFEYNVDKNAEQGEYADGSTTYPFNELYQALSAIRNEICTDAIINLADGFYGKPEIETRERSYALAGLNTRIVINGNENDKTAVKINGLFIKDSYVELNNLTLDVDNYEGLRGLNSKIILNNVLITSSTSTNSTHSCIYISNNSYLAINNCKIDYGNEGIIATDSILNIKDLTVGTNLNNKFNINKTNIGYTDNLLFDNAQDKISNNFNRKIVNTPQLIYSGASYGSISLTKSLSKFDWCEIIYGDSGSVRKSTGKIYYDDSNNDRIELNTIIAGDNNTTYIKTAYAQLKNNNINFNRNRQITINANNNTFTSSDGDYIRIYKVIAGFNDYINLS